MARRPVDPRSTKPSMGRRVAKAIIGLTVTFVMLGGALVLVDMAVRDFAETRAESEIRRQVPGSSGKADVTINGFSMLFQIVQGELDDVDASFAVGAEGLGRMASSAGYASEVRIADGAVELLNQIDVLGMTVPYSVLVEPSLDEFGFLVLTAVGVTAADAIEIDLTPFVDLASAGIRVCSASLLPESITLSDVTVRGDEVVITAHGSGVPTNLDALSARGECVTEPPAPE